MTRAAAAVRVAVWLLVLMAVGCSDDPQADSAPADVAASTDAAETPQDQASSADTGEIDASSECPGGAFCACQSNDECDGGLCIETPAGRQCAAKCVEDCPGGFVCRTVPNGSDSATICVPAWGKTCRPCNTAADCAALGHGGAQCVNYGTLGAFCGVGCETSKDCPVGSTCKDATSISGATSKQCVRVKGPGAPAGALFGVCDCSPAARTSKASTTCWLDDPEAATARRCKGVLQCADDGLGSCDVISPKQCEDAQCEAEQDGKTCDDQDPCTENDRCANNVCTPGADLCACHVDADCQGAADADLCAGQRYCDTGAVPYACKLNAGTVVECAHAGNTACLLNTCDPKTGTCSPVALPTKTTCDDGDVCSAGDHCQDGSCLAGPDDLCACHTTADCAMQEDDSVCNGTLYCDKSSGLYACKINPATVVSCPQSQTGTCSTNACQEASKTCKIVPANDGGACDDGFACTKNDFCAAGACVPASVQCQCQTSADCAKYDDNDLCNGVLFCDKEGEFPACKHNPASVVVCPKASDTACAINTCQPVDGSCKPIAVAQKKPCDDGNTCSTGDHCAQGVCAPSANTCSCTKDEDCAPYEDGDSCNGLMFCDLAVGGCTLNPASMVTCTTVGNTACRAKQCQPKTGQCTEVPINHDLPCDDGNICTSGDACVGGWCAAGKNTCECQKNSDCAGKGDGNLCDGPLVCAKVDNTYKCQKNIAQKVVCPTVDDTDCSKNACDPQTGGCSKTAADDGAKCDDGDPCTEQTGCKSGVCEGGAQQCECTVDADCLSKDDKDPCNGTLYCAKTAGKGSCAPKPGSAITCDASADTLCQRNTCEPSTGKCQPAAVNNGKTCDDANPCTLGDVCAAAACSSGQPKPCGDADPCAAQACNPKSGQCEPTPLQDGDKCDDGNGCTVGETCQGKVCSGPAKSCDDANACTLDSCAKATGQCSHAAVGDGLTCDADGDGCTPLDACDAGVCKAGSPLVCDDGNPCTDDSCDAAAGKCAQKANTKACSDSDACTTGDVCGGGQCTKGKATVCDDKNQCTTDSCNSTTGACTFTKHANFCDDGMACTVGERCNNGACKGTVHCVDNNPCTLDHQCSGGKCVYPPLGWEPQCGANRLCVGASCVTKNPPSGMLTVYGTGPGGFAIGCPAHASGECGTNEKPNKQIRVNSFWIDKHEVRASEYKTCVQNSGCIKPSKIKGDGGATYNQPGKENHPVNFVNQKQARTFCTAMRGAGGRLCSEAEWEWAARGPSLNRFPWGNNNNGCELANWTACGNQLQAVGGRGAGKSWIGAHDMAGNIWEWVEGWFQPYEAWGNLATNPVWMSDPGTGKKVNRGGSCWTGWQQIRTTERNGIGGGTADANRGFRCCKSMPL